MHYLICDPGLDHINLDNDGTIKEFKKSQMREKMEIRTGLRRKNQRNSVITKLSTSNFDQHRKRGAVFKDFVVVRSVLQGRRDENRSGAENISFGSLGSEGSSRYSKRRTVWLR